MEVPEAKAGILADAEQKVEGIRKNFKRGLITDEERYNEYLDFHSGTERQSEIIR